MTELTTAEDDQLLRLAREDPTEFARLYVRHRERVFEDLRGRTRNDEDALELAAVTFERAFATVGDYRPQPGGVLAWLLAIALEAAAIHRGAGGVATFPIGRRRPRMTDRQREALDRWVGAMLHASSEGVQTVKKIREGSSNDA